MAAPPFLAFSDASGHFACPLSSIGLTRPTCPALQAFHRAQMLQRIEDDTARARALLEARTHLQQRRKDANVEASLQRQQLLMQVRTRGLSDVPEAALKRGLASALLLKKSPSN